MSNVLSPGDKPGWKTTEFWLTLASQFIGTAVLCGWIPSGDSNTIAGQVAKIVGGVFAAYALGHYIKGRVAVKIATGLFLLMVLLSPGAASAQGDVTTMPTSCARKAEHNTCLGLFGRRQQQQQTDPAMLAALQQISSNQQQMLSLLQQLLAQPKTPLGMAVPYCQPYPQSAPPALGMGGVIGGSPVPITVDPIKLAPVPPAGYQTIPLGAAPIQQIPLGGQPYQQVPLGGAPYQQVPLGAAPQQQIPLGTPPLQQIVLNAPSAPPAQQMLGGQQSPQSPQQIPLGGQPQQQIPLGGQPYQQIPLGGQPQQQIPLGGMPYQQVPLGGQPQQQIPLGGQAQGQQSIPLGSQPQQQSVPLGTPPGQVPLGTQPGQQGIPFGTAPGQSIPPSTMPRTNGQTTGPQAWQRFTTARPADNWRPAQKRN